MLDHLFFFFNDFGKRVSYHAGDKGHRAGALPAGVEHTTPRQIPVECHICDSVLSGVDDNIGRAGSMYSGLKIMIVASPFRAVNMLFALEQSPWIRLSVCLKDFHRPLTLPGSEGR